MRPSDRQSRKTNKRTKCGAALRPAGRVSAMRSRIMAAVRGKNTKPELLLRRALTNEGLRYRLHRKGLPGTPDIIFPCERIAIFCDGDFWHGRNWKARKAAGQFKVRKSYWCAKIETNIARDKRVNRDLRKLGWTVKRYWNSNIETSSRQIAREIRTLVKTTMRRGAQ